MSLLSSLAKLFKAVLSKVWKALREFVKRYWVLILVIVLIWFAPAIAGWLLANSGPAWLVSVFETLAIATPYLVGGLTWIWEGASAAAVGAWHGFVGLDLVVKSALLLGTAAAIVPEETTAVVAEIGSLIGETLGAVTSGIISGVGGSGTLLMFGLAAVGIFFFMKRGSDDRGIIKLGNQPSGDLPLLA